jgi:ABC-type transport system substrate-binding protein
MGSAGEVNDPSFLSLFLQGPPAFQRSFGFNSTQVNDLLAKGLRLSTVAERKPVYDQIQELMIEQAPIVPLIWRDQAYGARSNVSGFANLPGFLTFYSGYTLEQTSLV